jgi:cell division protease FtsH
MSGADLANLMNESAIHSARNGKEEIDMEDVADAIEKIQIGVKKIGDN